MTFLGKTLVLINSLLAIVFMAFAMMVYFTRVEYQKAASARTQQIAQLSGERDGLTRENEALKQQIAEHRADIDQKVKAHETTAANLKKQIEDAVTELNRSRNDAASLGSQVSSSTIEQRQRLAEVEKLRQDRDALIQKNADLVNKNTSLQDQLNQANNTLALANSRNEQVVDRIRQLEGYIVKTRGSVPEEAELKTGQDVPPPPNVEGIVTKVDKNGKFLQISLGEDDGIRKGQVLEVWRTKPEPKYLGRIQVNLTDPTTAVAKPLSISGLIQENDRVGARILMSGN